MFGQPIIAKMIRVLVDATNGGVRPSPSADSVPVLVWGALGDLDGRFWIIQVGNADDVNADQPLEIVPASYVKLYSLERVQAARSPLDIRRSH